MNTNHSIRVAMGLAISRKADGQMSRHMTRQFSRMPMLCLVCCALSLVYSRTGGAQQGNIVVQGSGAQLPPELQEKITELMMKSVASARADVEAHTARLMPGLIVADSTDGSATLELSNHSDDTLPVVLTVGTASRVPVAAPDLSGLPADVAASVQARLGNTRLTGDTNSTAQTGNPLLTNSTPDSNAAQAKVDSVDASHSLASWITDLPKSVTLLPHETKKITIHAVKPANIAPGTYSAWIVAVTQLTTIKPSALPAQTQTSNNVRFISKMAPSRVSKGSLQSSAKINLQVGR